MKAAKPRANLGRDPGTASSRRGARRPKPPLEAGGGKGKKDRVTPVGARALGWVERYLAEVRPELVVGLGEKALFLSAYGEAFNADVVTRMVADYIRRADIGRSGSCHLLRHTCATLMLENGADIRHIQQLLGHANLSTTQIYTEVSIRQLQKVHELTHPAKRHKLD